jgi:adenylosuccinate lyase
MHERYTNDAIARIFSSENKLGLWQETEFAVLEACAACHECSEKDVREIKRVLLSYPINIKWWKKRDKVVRHDLNAFLEERLRFLPKELQPHFHRNMTSYDTEEPAFARMLIEAMKHIREVATDFERILVRQAREHRYTIMISRTHGQQAELQTHGKRCLTWLQELRVDLRALETAAENLSYAKISGAVGNWGALHPQIEERALEILGLRPFYGATQIIPRALHAPLAQALAQLVQTLHKIALDIRLNARTPRPIYQEPFGKKQKGSSAMPHKKNTISTEQLEGMARMARQYAAGILENIATWEERAIEQSCVERVFWPDLFHVVLHSLRTMHRVVNGLVIHRHHMLLEILEARGCYATTGAKEVLKRLLEPLGLPAEAAYRIIQLAAFNIFAYGGPQLPVARSFDEAAKQLELVTRWQPKPPAITLEAWIRTAQLVPSPELEASQNQVVRWNRALRKVFASPVNREEWAASFEPAEVLKHENHLFEAVLG